MGATRGRAGGFIRGAIVTLIAAMLIGRTRRQAMPPVAAPRSPEPAADQASSPAREREQSFWRTHSRELVGLGGALGAALIGAIVVASGTLVDNWQQERSAQLEYQSDLVLRALKPDDPELRAEQLRFLLDTQLLTDDEIRENLTAYLNGPNALPQFDAAAAAARVRAQLLENVQLASELGCNPSYEPCVPNASDADCLGGDADGPAYAPEVAVVGRDVYGLDTDGDGIGCEGS